jgi:hypothetical protein
MVLLRLIAVLVFGGLTVNTLAEASTGSYPICKRQNQRMNINNQQVITWKTSTKNQYLDRGFVEGQVVQALVDRGSHLHIEVNLDPSSNDRANHIELVYNKSFGKVPAFRRGSQVAACGDYITSSKDTPRYKKSPVDAIIHWIHMSPKPERHESGFLMLDGVLTGQVNPDDRRNFAIDSLWQAFLPAWSN